MKLIIKLPKSLEYFIEFSALTIASTLTMLAVVVLVSFCLIVIAAILRGTL